MVWVVGGGETLWVVGKTYSDSEVLAPANTSEPQKVRGQTMLLLPWRMFGLTDQSSSLCALSVVWLAVENQAVLRA